ncbi:MAG TPA: PEP-CTERM sorting domain-containing protein [Gemmataceae bacterium]|nr:PEP-CTERM sorting domain-containing protein [Gemmataceae bacterium]
MSRSRLCTIATLLFQAAFASSSIGRADFVYSGLATGAVPTVEITFLIGSTGPLPSNGGVREVTLPSSNFGTILSTGLISGVALGSTGIATADITVQNLLLVFGGITISAQTIGGHAVADGHTGGRPEVGGFSDFVGLSVNGQAVAVSGAPNQRIDLPNEERLVLNEQFVVGDDNSGIVTVNALHLYVNPVVDFRIATAEAGMLVDPSTTPTPEPGTLALVAVGLIGLVGFRLGRGIRTAG